MAYNKIIFGGETLIDLTSSTVSKSNLLSGITAYDKSGVKITGECTYDSDTSDADADVAEVLLNKIYYANGARKQGTMPNRAGAGGTISTKAGTYTIQQGYHDGSGTVGISSTEQAKIIAGNIKNGVTILGVSGTYTGESTEVPQSKTVNAPISADMTVTPDAGYTCLSQVVVKKVSYVETANSYGTTVTIG